MFFKLKDFLTKLAGETKFQRYEMTKFMKSEIQNRMPLSREYKTHFKDIWTKWKRKRSSSNIAGFFKGNGKKLMTGWLSKVFPFNHNRLKVKFSEGGTSVDIILDINYSFEREEITSIAQILKENEIVDVSDENALIRIFSETILSFPLIWTEYFGYEFTIMPENEEKKWKDDSLKIKLRFSARPAY